VAVYVIALVEFNEVERETELLANMYTASHCKRQGHEQVIKEMCTSGGAGMRSCLQHPKADNDITGAGATPLYKQTGTPRVKPQHDITRILSIATVKLQGLCI
jgi:hypothetical protein